MKRFFGALLSFCGTAALLSAASLPKTSIVGDYVEARTADVYVAACYANSEAGLVGNLAVMGWRVNQGSWNGVKLDGLGVVGVVKAKATLGDPNANPLPAKSVLIVDQKASPEQRVALMAFAKHMGGQLFADVVQVDEAPIQMIIAGNSVHNATASLTAGALAEIKTRPISEKDALCHNEKAWYDPMTKLDHAMPAYALENTYAGKALGTVWKSQEKRSAYVGTFHAEN